MRFFFAEMAFLFMKKKPRLDRLLMILKGGSGAIVDALFRGIEKDGGGQVLLSTPVEQVLVENGIADTSLFMLEQTFSIVLIYVMTKIIMRFLCYVLKLLRPEGQIQCQ